MSSAFSKSFVFVYPHVHARTAFSKSPFTLIVFMGYVWTEAVSVKKNLCFQMKTDTGGWALVEQNGMVDVQNNSKEMYKKVCCTVIFNELITPLVGLV